MTIDLALVRTKLAHRTPRIVTAREAAEQRAAVAAILRQRGRGTEVLFIRRAERPGDPWSGHMAFPGGRASEHDPDLLATAIRETREEVGIDLSPAHLLGRLPDLPAFSRARGTNLVVTPFVFALRSDPVIVPNRVEVATTLWVPLATLANGVGKTSFELDYAGQRYVLPCIHLEPGQHRLWGMTYRMLETLLDALR